MGPVGLFPLSKETATCAYLSLDKSSQSSSSNTIQFNSILILLSQMCLGLRSVLFVLRFPHQTFVCISCPRLSHISWFEHPDCITAVQFAGYFLISPEILSSLYQLRGTCMHALRHWGASFTVFVTTKTTVCMTIH